MSNSEMQNFFLYSCDLLNLLIIRYNNKSFKIITILKITKIFLFENKVKIS